MKERPILMRPELVGASLLGRKTQTRRVLKWDPASPADVSAARSPDRVVPYHHADGAYLLEWDEPSGRSRVLAHCPYGVPGDRLWVRETWRICGGMVQYQDFATRSIPHGASSSDVDRWAGKSGWQPSIYMPRWASRLTLEIVSVRLETLQSIGEEDVRAEGVDPGLSGFYRSGFCAVWDAINEKRGYNWEFNPWVWVVEYRVLP